MVTHASDGRAARVGVGRISLCSDLMTSAAHFGEVLFTFTASEFCDIGHNIKAVNKCTISRYDQIWSVYGYLYKYCQNSYCIHIFSMLQSRHIQNIPGVQNIYRFVKM